ncbi:MAG: ABC transporter substrate-binding protein [Oscillospiraceae bacterium]|nr:ABC transporter substrate-binding protein [Oscillospiraceae bacterium]
MNAKRFTALLAILALCVTFFAGCSAGKAADSEGAGDGNVDGTIKIGFIGPLTGDTAQYGNAVCNGAKMYFDKVNAEGGINGMKIDYITLDSEGDPATAVNAYSRLVDQEGVCAIVGPVLTGETVAVAEEAAADGIPMVTASATGDSITDIGDTLFRTCFKDSFQGTKMADYISEVLGYTKVAALYNNADAYSTGLYGAFEAECAVKGIEIVDTESFATGDTDFKAQLTNIAAKSPEALYFPCYYADCYMAASQAKEIGLNVPFLGGDGFDGLCGIENVDPTIIEGFIYSAHFASDAGSDEVKAVAADYKSQFSVEPLGFSYLAYDAAMIIVASIKSANSTDWAAIVTAMKATDMDCLTGHYKFDADNNPIKQCAMTKIENGEYVFDRMF